MIRKLSIIVSIFLVAASATTVLTSRVAMTGSGATWSYEGVTGPDQWGDLAANWAVCGTGHYQSPIDITGGISADLSGISASIQPTPLSFGLDGPTFAVPYQSGSQLTINGTGYELQQFHFHHPSEHTLNGRHFPMEAHLVLKADNSDHANAVLGVFIEAGSENAMLNQFWNTLPRYAKKSIAGTQVNVGDILPENKAYYMYEGSMTTPGCPQGVRWFVLEHPIQASQAQIDAFIADLTQGETNNRPIQPAYGRAILKGM